jgi:hypothetical protein
MNALDYSGPYLWKLVNTSNIVRKIISLKLRINYWLLNI